MQTETDTCLIRLPEVQKLTGMARSTIYARMTNGEFPRPLKLSTRHVAWKVQHILDWIESLPSSAGANWTNNHRDAARNVDHQAAGAK
jgi:prophage regulatory protein